MQNIPKIKAFCFIGYLTPVHALENRKFRMAIIKHLSLSFGPLFQLIFKISKTAIKGLDTHKRRAGSGNREEAKFLNSLLF